MDRRAVRLEKRHQLFGRGGFGVLQLRHPFAARLALVVFEAAARRLQHRSQNRARIADQTEIDVAVLADRAVVHVDLHQRQFLADALAVAHAEIERRADDDQHVGIRKGLRARAVEVMRIARRQQSTAGPVEVAGNVEAAQQRNRFFMTARGPHLLAVQNRGPLGIDEDVGELLDIARIADRFGRRPIVARLRHHRARQLDFAVEHVARNFQVRRTGRAVEAFARRHRDHVGDPLGARHAGGELGDRRHDVDVRQVLQRAHLVLRQRALSADMQDRAFRAERRGDARHRVHATGAGGRHHAAELAGLPRVTVRCVRGDLLVAHVDDANPFVDTTVVDIDDVAAAQREDRVDPFVFQRLGNQMATRDDTGIAGLLLERVFGRRAARGGVQG